MPVIGTTSYLPPMMSKPVPVNPKTTTGPTHSRKSRTHTAHTPIAFSSTATLVRARQATVASQPRSYLSKGIKAGLNALGENTKVTSTYQSETQRPFCSLSPLMRGASRAVQFENRPAHAAARSISVREAIVRLRASAAALDKHATDPTGGAEAAEVRDECIRLADLLEGRIAQRQPSLPASVGPIQSQKLAPAAPGMQNPSDSDSDLSETEQSTLDLPYWLNHPRPQYAQVSHLPDPRRAGALIDQGLGTYKGFKWEKKPSVSPQQPTSPLTVEAQLEPLSAEGKVPTAPPPLLAPAELISVETLTEEMESDSETDVEVSEAQLQAAEKRLWMPEAATEPPAAIPLEAGPVEAKKESNSPPDPLINAASKIVFAAHAPESEASKLDFLRAAQEFAEQSQDLFKILENAAEKASSK